MLTAYDENGIQIDISDANKQHKYYCVGCGKRMIPKQGSVRAHHFAHDKNANCLYDTDSMTDWHKDWQHLFGKGNYEIPSEYQETEGNGLHRKIADVLINDTVIEFQHSPISADEVFDRCTLHEFLNRRIIWLVDYQTRASNIVNKGDNRYRWQYVLHLFDNILPKDNFIELYLQMDENKIMRIMDMELDENNDYFDYYPYKNFIGKIYSKDEFLERMLYLCSHRLDGSYVALPNTNIHLNSFEPKLCYGVASDNKIISAVDAIKENKACYCPLCNSKLIAETYGQNEKFSLFRHTEITDCDNFTKSYDEWVHMWLQSIPNHFTECVIDNSHEKHFADIVINGYVIKFLSSDITTEEFNRINKFYTSIYSARANRNIKVLWIIKENKNNIRKWFSYAQRDSHGESIIKYDWLCWKQFLQHFEPNINGNIHVFLDISEYDMVSANAYNIANWKDRPDSYKFLLHIVSANKTYMQSYNYFHFSGHMMNPYTFFTDIMQNAF